MKKILFATAGVICVILGAIGVVTPVLPTTPFLLLATFLFSRSSPKMNKLLLENKVFGKYLSNYFNNKPIPVREKIFSISFLWTGFGLTFYFANLPPRVIALLVFIGIAISIHISTLGMHRLNFILKMLVLSWRIRFEKSVPEPAVIGLWHQDLPACFAAFKRRNIAVLISKSKDGSKFARLAESLGYNVFRGSSSRGQSEVRHLLEALKAGNSAGMALDGPIGPALVAKPGAEWLAQKAGVPLVNVSVKYSRAFRLKSWDKTFIPLPFSKISILY